MVAESGPADSFPDRITLPSFCKVNLWLEILGRRSDGYHELFTVFQSLDLCDELEIARTREGGITLQVEGADGLTAGPDNLVMRAAELFAARFGGIDGVRLRLKKSIPVGAGLGGGSSNAATTLLGLNALFNFPFGPEELAEMGALVGSDVPFFLNGGSAMGIGRGERIIPIDDLPLPESFLLVWPGFGVSTAAAYQLLAAPRVDGEDRLTVEQAGTKIRPFLEIIGAGSWSRLRNDLEEPVLKRFPALADLKGTLVRAGCPGVLLAGSGSTFVGLGDRPLLAAAADECRRAGFDCVFLRRGVGKREYLRRLGVASGASAGLR